MKPILQVGSEGFRKAALVCALAVASCMAAQAGLPLQTDVAQGSTAAAPNTHVLPWISDVVKMRDAGVPQDVIEVYAKNTRAKSAVTADDVLYLQSHGLSSGVITAMIEKGGAASQQAAPAPAYAAPAQTPAYAQPPGYPQAPIYPTAPTYQPAPTYQQQPDYGTDGSSVSVSYIGTPSYPYSYYYSYGYPYYYPYYYSYYPYRCYTGGRYCGLNGRTFCPTPFNHVSGISVNAGFHNFGTSRVNTRAFSSPRVGFGGGGGTRASFSTGGGGMRMASRR